MAGPDSNDNIKEKVQAVREVVLGKSNNEIVLVLQYYDYNVEKAIQAYLEDGAKEALGEWHVPPAKPNKKKKNKKKAAANAGQTDNGPSSGAAASSSSSVSVSSSQPSVSSAQPLPQRGSSSSSTSAAAAAVSNGISSSSNVQTKTSTTTTAISKPMLANGVVHSGSTNDTEVSTAAGVETPLPLSAAEVPSSQGTSDPSVSPTTTTQHHPHHRVHPGSHNHGHGHGHSQRNRSASERSTASNVGAGGDSHKKPFQGLEKAVKDLQRQTTSLERLGLMLDHEVDRSYKSIRVVFEEMRSHLNTREKQIMSEMDVVKQQAYEVFKMRQEKAAALKVQIESAEKLSDSELGDLRADVKHFVADRKMDEELGKTTRFQYDSDHLRDEIMGFGEVMSVKSTYAVRRPSVSSVASSGPGVEDVAPSSLHPSPPSAEPAAPSHPERSENAQMTTEELADLQIRLQNSLKIQGLAKGGKPANGSDNAAASKDDFQQSKSARRRNRNRERQEQRRSAEEAVVSASNASKPSGGESSSRAATPSSTQASAGSASPSPQRGPRRFSPHRGGEGGGYRGRGARGGPGGYRGGQQGRGSPRSRPYSGRGGGGGRGAGGSYYRGGSSRPPVLVNGGSS